MMLTAPRSVLAEISAALTNPERTTVVALQRPAQGVAQDRDRCFA
jgi:hypothetical protein